LLQQWHPQSSAPVDLVSHVSQHFLLPVFNICGSFILCPSQKNHYNFKQVIKYSVLYSKIASCERNTVKNTWPSAIITKTWYWPPLSSTIVMAISIIGANEVGPEMNSILPRILLVYVVSNVIFFI